METLIASVAAGLISGATTVIAAVMANNKSHAVLAERVERGNELVHHKIDRLSDRVDKHNGLIERMVVVEQSTKAQWQRIDELKDGLEAVREEQ